MASSCGLPRHTSKLTGDTCSFGSAFHRGLVQSTARTRDDVPEAAAEGDAVDLDQRLAAVRRPLRCGEALDAHAVAQPAGLHLADLHPRCTQQAHVTLQATLRALSASPRLPNPFKATGFWSSHSRFDCAFVRLPSLLTSPATAAVPSPVSQGNHGYTPGDATLTTLRTALRPAGVETNAGSAAATRAASAAAAASHFAKTFSHVCALPSQLHQRGWTHRC